MEPDWRQLRQSAANVGTNLLVGLDTMKHRYDTPRRVLDAIADAIEQLEQIGAAIRKGMPQ